MAASNNYPATLSRGVFKVPKWGFIFVATLMLAMPAAFAQLELQVKAALMVSFTTLSTWNTPPASFTIGVLGADIFGPNLENIAKLKSIPVKKFNDAPSSSAADILFVGADQAGNIAAISGASRPGQLLVGEGDEFVAGGGHVAFVLRDGKVRFKLNAAAADAKGIKFSPRLTSLAAP
jgi:YfiR/HmsC-like